MVPDHRRARWRAQWRALTTLRIALVGAGRSGSVLARLLVAEQCRLSAVIDPDLIEDHNLGEGVGYGFGDLGRPKARALVEALRGVASRLGDRPATAVAHPVDSPPALAAIKRADVVISAVDDARARLVTAVLAAMYLRPHIDVGTGIQRNGDGRRLGADVRLTVPGRCMACMGGIGDLTTRGETRPWWQTRAGSLASLNHVATGQAVRLLEDLAGGRVRGSVWCRYDDDAGGSARMATTQDPPAAPQPCPICAAAGRGDDGVREFSRLVAGATSPSGSFAA